MIGISSNMISATMNYVSQSPYHETADYAFAYDETKESVSSLDKEDDSDSFYESYHYQCDHHLDTNSYHFHDQVCMYLYI